MFSSPKNVMDNNTVAIGFVRGEQFVEVLTVDGIGGDVYLYLVVFEQACNVNNQCGNADLLIVCLFILFSIKCKKWKQLIF